MGGSLASPAEFVVLGLGNPGAKFERTRHNVGADAVLRLGSQAGAVLKTDRQIRALAALAKFRCPNLEGELITVALAFPQTFMNESGYTARAACRRYEVGDLERLIVVHDDLDLPPGSVRIKKGGGTGGHNGLSSIGHHMHGNGYLRVRIGVGKPPSKEAGANYVLSQVPKAERETLDTAIDTACEAVLCIVCHGVDRAMNEFNSK